MAHESSDGSPWGAGETTTVKEVHYNIRKQYAYCFRPSSSTSDKRRTVVPQHINGENFILYKRVSLQAILQSIFYV